MSPERWRKVEKVFEQAVEQEPDRQATFLVGACDGDDELRSEVESLLRADHDGAGFLGGAVLGAAAKALGVVGPIEGSRLGAYRIVRELGRGGMGTVYLAARDDDQFQKLVAVKIVKRGMDTDFVLQRFRYEREILARLSHPDIARLIDAGNTDDGLPYLVMEYVPGVPLTEYCSSRNLTLDAVLELFEKVCGVVHYAHRSLVVHRDLKPSNILVDEEGTPRLLDFGIAKLLSEDANLPATKTSVGGPRALTPDYASPEQVRGESVTTATDIYSLGALLYELVTGSRPHRLTGHTVQQIEQAICHNELERPSAARRRVEREQSHWVPIARRRLDDLDTILCRAMHKDPARRYGSAEQFAEDLLRYRQGQPVIARGDDFAYRTGMFLSRHRVPVLAGGLVLVLLIFGLVSFMHQARLAQRRFQQVQRLSHAMVFEVYDAVRDVPGSMRAQGILVKTALDYLDTLANEAGNDRTLLLQLADAYARVGDVQGGGNEANLGRTETALASYHKGLAIVDALAADDPQEAGVARRRLRLRKQVGTVLCQAGRTRDGLAAYARALADAEAFPALLRHAPLRVEVATLHQAIAREEKDPRVSLRHAERAGNMLAQAALNAPENAELQTAYSDALSMLGVALQRQHRPQEAATRFRDVLALRQRLCERQPDSVLLRRQLMIAHGQLGDALSSTTLPSLGDRAAALAEFAKAADIASALAAVDPANQRAQMDRAIGLMRVADVIPEGRPEAIVAFDEARTVLERLSAADTDNMRLRHNLVHVLWRLSLRLDAAGQRGEAFVRLREALPHAEAVGADQFNEEGRRSLLEVYRAIAAPLVARRDVARARTVAQKARALAEAANSPNDQQLGLTAFAWQTAAEAQCALALAGHAPWPPVADAFRRSVAAWEPAKQQGPLSALHQARHAELEVAQRRCTPHL